MAIADTLARLIGAQSEARDAAAVAAAPVRLRAKARTFYRGRPLEAGSILELSLAEAAEVHSWRFELVDSADAERLRDESHRQVASFDRGNKLAAVPWMQRIGG